MTPENILLAVPCCACGAALDAINVVATLHLARWDYPRLHYYGETRTHGVACAFVCSACIKSEREPIEAVEFINELTARRHSIDSLEPVP